MDIDLPLAWAAVILFAVMMYVLMDGFDLGIGLLYPFFHDKTDRDVMMNTVAPVWDGNETWLVFGGAGMLAAFPLAYAVVLTAFYLPLVFMLLGLIFRGVAFEFRFKAHSTHRRFWDVSFIGGSLVATFFQGVTLGGFIQGIPVVDRAYAGGPFDWLTPFSIFVGAGLVVTYALLGCTWLILKTDGPLQARMIAMARPLTWMLLVVIGIVSLWTPYINDDVAQRWFSLPNLFWLAPVPLLVGLTAWQLLLRLRRDPHAGPFLLALFLALLGYGGLGISLWPHIVPPAITIWQAAAPAQSLSFTLVGAVLVIPLILGYTAWAYYVFRGKVDETEGYHH